MTMPSQPVFTTPFAASREVVPRDAPSAVVSRGGRGDLLIALAPGVELADVAGALGAHAPRTDREALGDALVEAGFTGSPEDVAPLLACARKARCRMLLRYLPDTPPQSPRGDGERLA